MSKPVLSLSEQETLLETLKKIPLKRFLLDCNTDDRKKHWLLCKSYFYFLFMTLNDLLSNSNDFIESLSVEQKKVFVLHCNYYLELYKVLRDGWRYIEEKAYSGMPSTPIQMLCKLLEWESVGFLAIAFPELTGNYCNRFSPQKSYRLLNKRAEINNLLSQKKYCLNLRKSK